MAVQQITCRKSATPLGSQSTGVEIMPESNDSTKIIECAIEWCKKPRHDIGMCGMHARRMRKHGNPLYIAPKRSKIHDWIMTIASTYHNQEECIEWPYSKNNDGYGQATFKGRSGHAHALVLRECKGPHPKGKTHASHECGNRLCANPNHLNWKTPKENNNDRYRHGTISGEGSSCSILTELDVIESRIRHQNGEAITQIAKTFPQVTMGAVYNAIKKRTWKSV